jgi:multiple sugar transport system permease protein
VKHPIQSGLVILALIIGGVMTATPLFWMISASFMPTGEATTYPPHLLPSHITFEHYADLFHRLNFGRTFMNSAIIAIGTTLISLLLNSMAGYAFAKLRFRGRDRVFALLIGALAIPLQVGMLPLFLFLKSIGLVNSYWGVMMPSLATIFGIFLMRQFMLSIPDEVLEAARMDGASEVKIFFRIILPLSVPVIVTLAIFQFMSIWNDFMWPLIVLTDSSKYTLPVAIANLVGEHVQDAELMMAGSVITILPVLLLFLFLQRYYIAGLMAGSVKG